MFKDTWRYQPSGRSENRGLVPVAVRGDDMRSGLGGWGECSGFGCGSGGPAATVPLAPIGVGRHRSTRWPRRSWRDLTPPAIVWRALTAGRESSRLGIGLVAALSPVHAVVPPWRVGYGDPCSCRWGQGHPKGYEHRRHTYGQVLVDIHFPFPSSRPGCPMGNITTWIASKKLIGRRTARHFSSNSSSKHSYGNFATASRAGVAFFQV